MSRNWVRERHEAAHPVLAGLTWDETAEAWTVATKIQTDARGRQHAVGVWVAPLMYTSAILIGPVGALWYDDRWCYKDPVTALEAARAWGGPWNGGEPAGWHRHPRTGRRRDAGDPATERISH